MTFGRTSRLAAATLAVMLILAPAAADGPGPEDFIRALANQALELLAKGDLTAPDRRREFRRLFVKSFDVDTIGRFVLGRYWRRASPAERTEYRKLFEDYVVFTYAARLSQYSGQTLVVKSSRRDDSRDSVVHSVIKSPDGPPVRVDWRVRRRGDEHVIVDVVVEGVSMALTQRSEFASVVRNAGGRVSALLDRLREQVARYQ